MPARQANVLQAWRSKRTGRLVRIFNLWSDRVRWRHVDSPRREGVTNADRFQRDYEFVEDPDAR
jgi:hypothetical protein